jgi:hypothetical protein
VGPPSPVRRSKSGEAGERVTKSGRPCPPGGIRAANARACATFRARAVNHHTPRSPMKIHHLYVDKQGESHFEDMEIPYTESGRAGKLSARLPATGIIFREVAPDYDLDWHPAPRRQYIINLDAGVQITASDGQSRKIGAGEVILVEDTWGKGHLSKALDGKLRHCIFVPIE